MYVQQVSARDDTSCEVGADFWGEGLGTRREQQAVVRAGCGTWRLCGQVGRVDCNVGADPFWSVGADRAGKGLSSGRDSPTRACDE